MYLTHTFASRDTLSRAHTWLTRHGFNPRHTASGTPRIMIVDGADRLAAAQMLINVAENADPNGFPGLWDRVSDPCTTPEPHHQDGLSQEDSLSQPRKPQHAVLGWHPLD